MLVTLNKKLIYEAQQNADYTIANFSQVLTGIALANYYDSTILDDVLVAGQYTIQLKAKTFPNIQVLISQFISNPNSNPVNLYFVVSVDNVPELGQLQTIPANTNNYLIKDTISPLLLTSFQAGTQQHLLAVQVAFPTNTGTSALTFNKGLYTGSSVVSTIKLLV